MSVTFMIDRDHWDWVVKCDCGEYQLPDTYRTAGEALRVADQESSKCINDYCLNELCITAVNEDVNLSNTNARFVLDKLGFDVAELVGGCSAEEFKGRVLLALALYGHDEGVPPTTTGNVTDCGRAEGYLQQRLTELLALSENALSDKKWVCWA